MFAENDDKRGVSEYLWKLIVICTPFCWTNQHKIDFVNVRQLVPVPVWKH